MPHPTRVVKSKKKSLKVCVIGGGWSGRESAITMKKNGHDVSIFEKGEDGPAGTTPLYSGHTHPSAVHYLRIPKKYIKYFIENYSEFKQKRGKFLRDNPNSIHGIVDTDAKGRPSRTSVEKFRERCKFDPSARKIELADFNLHDFQEPVAINEERIINGEELKEQFRLDYLKEDIPFYYNTPVTEVTRVRGGYLVKSGDNEFKFDKVVNATGYQKFLPPNFHENPFELEVIYQPLVGIIYEDMMADKKDIFSLLLLDGANPCLMPCGNNRYLLTHCGYTLLASCATPEEAWKVINSVTVDFVKNQVKPKAEADLQRYVSDFFDRFKPVGYNAGVIAKPNTANEFRLSFAFESPDPCIGIDENDNGIIHVFPGKIASSIRASREVLQLVEHRDLSFKKGYKYPTKGMLDVASKEIASKPKQDSKLHYSCKVNPYPELLSDKNHSYSSNTSCMWRRSEFDNRLFRYYEQHEAIYPINSRKNSETEEVRNSLSEFGFL